MAVIKYRDENNNIYELPLLVPMDGALSSESENGVQNKVIKKAFDEVNTAVGSINSLLDDLNGEIVPGQKVSKAIESKTAIKAAIANKGVTIPSNATLASYSSYVEQIVTGVTPSGNIEISAQTGTNVANYATASVKSGSVNTPTLSESWNTSHNRLTITANALSTSGWINSNTIVGQSKTYTPDDFGIKNVQCSPVVTQIKNKTSMTATDSTITVSKAGTYRCSWVAWSYANGSSTYNYSTQLYKNNSAVGSSHYASVYSGTSTFVFTETLTLAEGDVLVVRARTRSGNLYYTTAGMLCIEEQ